MTMKDRFPKTLFSRRAALMSLLATSLAAPAWAAQTDITISTAPAPATPKINGPSLLGAIPASPFLYTIAATGQAPLKFEAAGLPTGLTLDAASGTISGTTPAAGSYDVALTVSNSAGSATRTLTLKAGPTVALTPPMGWNSYDSFIAAVKESDVVAAAKAMKTYLQPYGWNYLVIDYLWYDPEKTVDANGRWLPSTSKYPSATGDTGFKSVAEQVHGQGLNFGIHLMRGIPRLSVDSKKSPIADSTFTAAQAADTGDKCSWDEHMYGVKGDSDAGKAWYDSIYKQYASWNVDFVKVDDMMNPYGGNVTHASEVVAVHDAIVKTGRSIVFSLSPGPFQTKDAAVLNANANMWRQVNDFWDNSGSLSSMTNEYDAAYAWSTTNGITQGHWPDADMLPLGTIGNRTCQFSKNVQVQVMTLWSIMPSPLMFGGMPTKLGNDAWTLALLTNDEVLAVNQDALGARGKRIAKQGNSEVWAKDLSGGRKAVALFNRDTQDATVSVTFAQLGITGEVSIRDLWNKKDVTGMTEKISVNVPHESALLYALTPPGGDTPDGGISADGGGTGGSSGRSDAGAAGSTGSAGGTGGKGGATGTAAGGNSRGGNPATGGVSSGGLTAGGGASMPAGGGSSSSSAARGGSSSGGQSSQASSAVAGMSGNASSKAGASGSGSGTAAGGDSGCSCTLASPNHSSLGGIIVLAALVLGLRPRRRRTR